MPALRPGRCRTRSMSLHEFRQIPPRGTNVEDNAQRSAPRRYVAQVHNTESGTVEFLGSPDKTLCFPNRHHERRRHRRISEAPDIAAARRLVDANVASKHHLVRRAYAPRNCGVSHRNFSRRRKMTPRCSPSATRSVQAWTSSPTASSAARAIQTDLRRLSRASTSTIRVPRSTGLVIQIRCRG